VGYRDNPFIRVKNLVTGRGAEMWEAEEGCAMHAEILLKYSFFGREWFYLGIMCVCVCVRVRARVCVKAHFHVSKCTFRIKDLFYVVADEYSAPPSRHLKL